MENLRALLGVHASADIGEIEEAYRSRKRFYDPGRFVEGSLEWEFARARNAALDRAWAEASAAALSPRHGAARSKGAYETEYAEGRALRELSLLFLSCPILVALVQLLIPSVLSDAAPGELRGGVHFFAMTVALLSCSISLLIRLALFGRPRGSLSAALLYFLPPLLSADLSASLLLHFFFRLPGQEFQYIPALYLWGWGAFPVVLCTHCAMLTLPLHGKKRKSVPLLRRLASCTMGLFLSTALSMAVCVAFNRETLPVAEENANSAAAEKQEKEEWRHLELLDAGVMEIPASWYVEDSNGTLRSFEQGQTVQYVREALTAHTFGLPERGPDFVFEVYVYRWTRRDGSGLPPSSEALNRMQETQEQEFVQLFPDVTVFEKTRDDRDGRAVSVLTVETRSIPGYVVRLKNLVFEEDGRLFSLTLSYPADEESGWTTLLERILRRWRIGESME
ncbi:MAG: hypothetical protein LBQ90_04255 [Synergistaceae bacterium]|nr:hypothetical protein [Synergistaceae bacterium]